MKTEYTIDQIREFVKKGYQSVAARYVKSALQLLEADQPHQQEVTEEEMIKTVHGIIWGIDCVHRDDDPRPAKIVKALTNKEK